MKFKGIHRQVDGSATAIESDIVELLNTVDQKSLEQFIVGDDFGAKTQTIELYVGDETVIIEPN